MHLMITLMNIRKFLFLLKTLNKTVMFNEKFCKFTMRPAKVVSIFIEHYLKTCICFYSSIFLSFLTSFSVASLNYLFFANFHFLKLVELDRK